MKIAIITSSRSDFGLLKNLMFQLINDKFFKLFVIATGSHFSKKNGYSVKEINRYKIKINKKIILKNRSCNSKDLILDFSILSSKIVDFFSKNKIDLFIALGDRYEIFAAVIGAYFSRVKIAHIHGGELTKGSMDDSIRHSITKLSNYHFVSNNIYMKRVMQLGEQKKNIYVVGGMGAENIRKKNFLQKKEIEKKIKIKFLKKIIIVNINPETQNAKKTHKLLDETFQVLSKINNTTIIFTLPSLDLESSLIHKRVKNFSKKILNAHVFESLGSELFYSILNIADMMVGNSSSGLLEMPSFKKPTINIGNRQQGRIEASSVITVPADKAKIQRAINKACSERFKNICKKTKNPYKLNNSPSIKIKNILKKIKKASIENLYKSFQDIKI